MFIITYGVGAVDDSRRLSAIQRQTTPITRSIK